MEKQKPRYARHNLCFNITKIKQRQADRYLCLCGKKQAEVIAALIDKLLRENGITDLSLLTEKEAKDLALKVTDTNDPVDRLSNLMESFLNKIASQQEVAQNTCIRPYVDGKTNQDLESSATEKRTEKPKIETQEPEPDNRIEAEDIDEYEDDEQGELRVNPELENSLNMFM